MVARGPKNILDNDQLEVLLRRVLRDTRRPYVERAVFLFSYKAGLRVQEIAGLQWERNLLDAQGRIRHSVFSVTENGKRVDKRLPVIYIDRDIGKYGSERTIRMHSMLYEAVLRLRDQKLPGPWVIPSGKKGASQDLRSRAHALKMRINRFYARIDYQNCSSHSGRRTFITTRARLANHAGCSLRDVQAMAGHRHIVTTEKYIVTTPNQADLVEMD